MYARGCKGLPGWFGKLFFHVCPFDREGGGDLSDLGNAHIEPTHFKKGLPFNYEPHEVCVKCLWNPFYVLCVSAER